MDKDIKQKNMTLQEVIETLENMVNNENLCPKETEAIYRAILYLMNPLGAAEEKYMDCDTTGNNMKRLTTEKPVKKMSMTELALNCCYVKDGEARYRDYNSDINARAFVRNLLVRHEVVKRDDEVLEDDTAFDEFMMDLLRCDPGEIEGLISLFYRNLWAMAKLYERLQKYEDSKSNYVPMAKARCFTSPFDNSEEKLRLIDFDKLMNHPWMHGKYYETANLHFVSGWKSCKEWIEQQPLIEISKIDLDEQ